MSARCIADLKERFKDKIKNGVVSEKEIENIVNDFNDVLQTSPNTAAFLAKANGIKDGIQSSLSIEKAESRREILRTLKDIDNMQVSRVKGTSPKKFLLNKIEGRSQLSTGVKAEVIPKNIIAQTQQRLKAEGLEEFAISSGLGTDIDIGTAAIRLKNNGDLSGFSPEVIKSAEILNELNQNRLMALRDGNVNVGEALDFLDTRFHHKDIMIEKKAPVWKAFMLNHMGEEEMRLTFGNKWDDVKFREKWLDEAYERIISPERGAYFPSMEPSKRVRVSEVSFKQRKIHLTPEGDVRYSQEWGNGRSLLQGAMKNAERDGRIGAIMQDWGVNPVKAVENRVGIFKSMLETEARANPDRAESIRAEIVELEQGLPDMKFAMELLQRRNRNSNTVGLLEKRVNNGRDVISMSSLGAVTVSSLVDPANATSFISSTQGRSWFGTHMNYFKNLIKNLSADEKSFAKKELRFIEEDIGAAAAERFGGSASGRGLTSRMVATFMKTVGIAQWTDHNKLTSVRTLSNILADDAEISWKNLPPQARQSFELFEINQKDRDVLKWTVTDLADGYPIMSVDKIDTIQDAVFVDAFGKSVNIPFAKRKLEIKLMGLLNEADQLGVPTPGHKTKRILSFGNKADSKMGIAASLAVQFKQHPTVLATEVIPRIAKSDPTRNTNWGALTQFGAGLTTYGAMVLMIKDLLSNKEVDVQANLSDPKFLIRAALKGGTFGLAGDFMLAEYDNSYRNFSTDLLGPTAQKANHLFKAFSFLKAGEGDKALKEFTTLADKTTPYQNHILFGPAVQLAQDHLTRKLGDPEHRARKQKREAEGGVEQLINFNKHFSSLGD